MLKKIVFSLVLSSACLLNSHSAEAAVDDANEADSKGSTVRAAPSSLPKPDFSGKSPKGWVFRDVLWKEESLNYWMQKAARHPNTYRVTENGHLEVYHD